MKNPQNNVDYFQHMNKRKVVWNKPLRSAAALKKEYLSHWKELLPTKNCDKLHKTWIACMKKLA